MRVTSITQLPVSRPPGLSIPVASNSTSAQPTDQVDLGNPARTAQCQLTPIGREGPTVEKEGLIRSMIRRAPDKESVCLVLQALSAYPLEALQRVHDYGTRLEVYDFQSGEPVPEYQPTLANPNVLGAYNTVANVLGADKTNLAPFVLMHEFAHALDASLGDVSTKPEWRNAHALASATNQVVRDYATIDSAEYLAENTAAYLVADEALYPIIEQGLEKHLGTYGLTEREYLQMNQNFCEGRLHRLDPDGYALVDDLLHHRLESSPPPQPKPAMTADQWQTYLENRPEGAT